MLIFSIGSISAQSANSTGSGDNKILKSNSLDQKTIGTTAKLATNTKVTNGKNTKTTTNTAKKTTTATTTKTSTAKKTASKESGSKKAQKANTTTVNKKTLAKTSTSFMNYVEKKGKFPKVKISNRNYSNTEYLYLVSKGVENNSN